MLTCDGCRALHDLLALMRRADVGATDEKLRAAMTHAQLVLDAHELREHRFLAIAYAPLHVRYPMGLDLSLTETPKSLTETSVAEGEGPEGSTYKAGACDWCDMGQPYDEELGLHEAPHPVDGFVPCTSRTGPRPELRRP